MHLEIVRFFDTTTRTGSHCLSLILIRTFSSSSSFTIFPDHYSDIIRSVDRLSQMSLCREQHAKLHNRFVVSSSGLLVEQDSCFPVQDVLFNQTSWETWCWFLHLVHYYRLRMLLELTSQSHERKGVDIHFFGKHTILTSLCRSIQSVLESWQQETITVVIFSPCILSDCFSKSPETINWRRSSKKSPSLTGYSTLQE